MYRETNATGWRAITGWIDPGTPYREDACMNTSSVVAIPKGAYNGARAIFEQAAAEGLAFHDAPNDEAGLAATISEHGARHAILTSTKYVDRLYDALPRGGVLARFGIGFDNINLALATSKGLLCTNAPGQSVESVVELTVALMLCGARKIPLMNGRTHGGTFVKLVGSELRGKRLAVIGCGDIGRRVAQCAAFGFGMEVHGCEVQEVDTDQMKREYGFAEITADFAEAVSDADFVTLHMPSSLATNHFVEADRLAQLAPKAWLINTARGAIVDETALFDALQSGVIRGAALDVYETEPYVPAVPGKDLRTLDSVIMMPHTGANTQEATNRVAERVVRNIKLAERNEYDEMDLLNPEVLNRAD